VRRGAHPGSRAGDFYSALGLRVVCPTKSAINDLMNAARACEIRPREPVAP
jgi:hypothetical protein